MGASIFFETSKGSSAQAAFDKAVEDALYDYGHSGYTGSIAEKEEFIMIPFTFKSHDPNERETELNRWFLDNLNNDTLDAIEDKWGPAGCTQIAPLLYAFYGWASN